MAHPAIDLERAGGVDLDRLERSLKLDGTRVGEGDTMSSAATTIIGSTCTPRRFRAATAATICGGIASASTSWPLFCARATTPSSGRSAHCSSA